MDSATRNRLAAVNPNLDIKDYVDVKVEAEIGKNINVISTKFDELRNDFRVQLEKTNEKIDKANEKTNEKIDKANEKIEKINEKLENKIDKLDAEFKTVVADFKRYQIDWYNLIIPICSSCYYEYCNFCKRCLF
jgi:DNA relaxase NicK